MREELLDLLYKPENLITIDGVQRVTPGEGKTADIRLVQLRADFMESCFVELNPVCNIPGNRVLAVLTVVFTPCNPENYP